jgi:hypothetical protein
MIICLFIKFLFINNNDNRNPVHLIIMNNKVHRSPADSRDAFEDAVFRPW